MNARDPLNERPLDNRQVSLLVVVLMAATLPHLGNLNPTPIGLFMAASLWQLATLRWPRLRPGKWLMAVLMLVGIALVVTSVSLRDGRLVGTALLVVMLGLKLLEMRNRRDMHVSVFLGYFVVVTQFLYNQSPWLALYLFALSGVLTALLVNANRRHFSPALSLRSAGLQILAALPVALLLFVFFPRLDAPLWTINLHNSRHITGISNHMSFGEIGRLSQSDALAFRVRFLDHEPRQQQLYWRGLVLWNYDGHSWTAGRPDFTRTPINISFDPQSTVDYEITMEPSGQRWLFPLDIPTQAPRGLRLDSDMLLRAPGEIEERMIYRFVSHTGYRLATLTEAQRQKGLQLPGDIGPRTRALAQQWRTAYPQDDAAVVDEALRYFNQQLE